MTEMKKSGAFVWIDCEMTGLDVDKEALIEIAVIVTDQQLNVIGEGLDIVIQAEQKYLDNMNDFVTNMHTQSGLLNELENGVSMDQAQNMMMEYIKSSVREGRGFLAGNSVGQDRLFLSKFMPDIIDYLHYRIVDVSTLKELAKVWYPEIYQNKPNKTGNHRALGDIKDSIAELEYYRHNLFVQN